MWCYVYITISIRLCAKSAPSTRPCECDVALRGAVYSAFQGRNNSVDVAFFAFFRGDFKFGSFIFIFSVISGIDLTVSFHTIFIEYLILKQFR